MIITDVLSPDKARPLSFSPTGVVEYEKPAPGDPDWERREQARLIAACTTLAGFIKYIWPEINPGRELVWGRHLDVICYMLEQLAYGRVERNELVICIPPRHLKSVTVSVCFPAWLWLRAPWVQTLGVASAEKVAIRDTKDMRRLVKSERYQNLVAFSREFFGDSGYPGTWTVTKDQDQKIKFENTAKGFREGLAAGAKITGSGADLFIVDDPVDAKEAMEGGPDAMMARMKLVEERYGGVWHSRLNNPKSSIRVCIMQRLHEADLAGVLLDRGVVSVVLPTEFDPDHPDLCPLDWRTEPGELLLEERLGREQVEYMKGCPEKGIKPTWTAEAYAAQHDQRPNPAGGGMFPKELWRRYTLPGRKLWEDCRKAGGLLLATYDCANTDTERAANSAIGLICRFPGQKQLILCHVVLGKWELPGLVAAFDQVDSEWRPRVHAVEYAGNGIGLVQMKQNTHNVYPIKPKQFGSKEQRAQVTKTYLIAENLLIPEDYVSPWVPKLIKEHAFFPTGKYADQVDMLSQGCIYAEVVEPVGGLTSHGLQFLEEIARRPVKVSSSIDRAMNRALGWGF